MDSQELSDLISEHVYVLTTFDEIVKWMQSVDGVALRKFDAVHIPEHKVLAGVSYLVNKSPHPETVAGCVLKTPAHGDWPMERAVAHDPPDDLAPEMWQRPTGLRLEPMSFAELRLFFPVSHWVEQWSTFAHREDPYRNAVSLRVETLGGSFDAEVDVYSVEGLRRSIKSRLEQ